MSDISDISVGKKVRNIGGLRNIRILSFLSDKNNKRFIKCADAERLYEYCHISQLSASLQATKYSALRVLLSEMSDTCAVADKSDTYGISGNVPALQKIPAPIKSSKRRGKTQFRQTENNNQAKGDSPADIFDSYAVLLVDMEQLTPSAQSTQDIKNKQPVQALPLANIRPAVIVWLSNVDVRQALKVAQINPDGIITPQNSPEEIDGIIANAIVKRERQHKIYRRYLKLRKLCRKHHHNHKKLEQKVDLICQDIVKSNVQLGATLEKLRKAYDFQNSLTGEFDLRYMLHKALRHIKEHITDSNAAIYLTEYDDFEAHIFGPWYDNEPDIQQIEYALRQSIIERVLQNQQMIMVADGVDLTFAHNAQRDELAGLSLLAVPVIHQYQLVAILVIYRNSEVPLAEDDLQSALLFARPLASAIAALSKLQGIIAT